MTFSKSMRQGDANLDRGDFIAAWWYFRLACWLNPRSSEAHRQRAECLRKLRCRTFAGDAFRKAYKLAYGDAQRGKVLRDSSMITLARKNYPLAIRQLQQAHKLLSSNGERLHAEELREYWKTVAHLGNAYRYAGDPVHAREIIDQARFMLIGDETYEFEAVAQLMAAESWPGRSDWLPYGLALAGDSRKRRLRLRLICVNAKLADALFP